MDQEERALQVQVHLLVPDVLGGVLERHGAERAGVADHQVESAVVRRHPDPPRRGGGAVQAPSHDGDARALRGIPLRNGETDALAPSRDDHCPIIGTFHDFSFLVLGS